MGTYRYRGTWEMIDQVIVSESLLSGKKRAFYHSGNVEDFQAGFSSEKGSEVSRIKSVLNIPRIQVPGWLQ